MVTQTMGIEMRKTVLVSTALGLCASAASAGGVDRSGQSVGFIYEEGNFVQLSYGRVAPDISGTQLQPSPLNPAAPFGSSGDAIDGYSQFSLAYKQEFEGGLSAAIIYDQPFGANVSYPDDEDYFAAGATADLDTSAVTGILKYTFPSNFSVFGGARYQDFEPDAEVPYIGGYSGTGDQDSAWGYLVGFGYEIPEIAMRISLTYNSAIEHTVETSEERDPAAAVSPILDFLGVPRALESEMEVETPQSVNLEFQTGIAPETLLFGGVRWVDWTEFEVPPDLYGQITEALAGEASALVSYDDDTWTYSLGIGRQLTEDFAGAVTLIYEPETGGFASNLGPTDGRFGIVLGGTYTYDAVSFTGGLVYTWIGDAETTLDDSTAISEWEDNDAVGFGLEVAYRF